MNKYIENLLEEKYNFRVNKHTFIGEGWMSKAYLLNDETILRVAKSDYASEDLFKESELMPYVNGASSFETPIIEIIDQQENGKYFMTYRAITGGFYDQEEFSNFLDSEKDQVLKALGRFITELKSIVLNDEMKKKYSVYPKSDYLEEYAIYTSSCFKYLSLETIAKIEETAKLYFEDDNNFSYSPKLIHRDISFDHLVFEPDSKKLKGVIDFGDMAYSDPDLEYMYILEEFGVVFTTNLMKVVNVKNVQRALSKAKFFLLIDNISIIHEGLKKDDSKMIDEGIKLVEQTISKFYHEN